MLEELWLWGRFVRSQQDKKIVQHSLLQAISALMSKRDVGSHTEGETVEAYGDASIAYVSIIFGIHCLDDITRLFGIL